MGPGVSLLLHWVFPGISLCCWASGTHHRLRVWCLGSLLSARAAIRRAARFCTGSGGASFGELTAKASPITGVPCMSQEGDIFDLTVQIEGLSLRLRGNRTRPPASAVQGSSSRASSPASLSATSFSLVEVPASPPSWTCKRTTAWSVPEYPLPGSGRSRFQRRQQIALAFPEVPASCIGLCRSALAGLGWQVCGLEQFGSYSNFWTLQPLLLHPASGAYLHLPSQPPCCLPKDHWPSAGGPPSVSHGFVTTLKGLGSPTQTS